MSFPGATPSYAGFTSGDTLKNDNHAAQHNAEQADIIALANKLGTGASTPTSGLVPVGNGVGTSAWRALTSADVGLGNVTNVSQTTLLQTIYPVGCIFTETTGTNPNSTFGFGTWTQYGKGQVLVGQNTGDPNFGTAGNTGGEATHNLTTAELASHSHSLTDPGHTHTTTLPANSTSGGTGNFFAGNNSGSLAASSSSNTTGITVVNAGSSSAHNNLQPFVTVYFWLRTA